MVLLPTDGPTIIVNEPGLGGSKHVASNKSSGNMGQIIGIIVGLLVILIIVGAVVSL